MKRYGEAVRRNQRYVMRPGIYAVLGKGRHVLVTHQAEPKPEMQLPGGGIDPGESPIPALHREVLEETGWTIARPRRLGAYRRFTYMPEYDMWAEKICNIYFATPALCLGPPREKGHTAFWMPAEVAFEELENDGDRDFLWRAMLA